jgi:hypothetical protein
MARIVYPSPIVPAYKGNISTLREELEEQKNWILKSPGCKPDWAAQVGAFMTQLGITPALPSTQTIVSNGQNLVVPVTGTYVTKAVPTVVGGVITAIVLS